MYLYKKNDKSITIYSFVPNKEELIKLKKRYLEDIKSVILHINDIDTKELLFSSPTIMFYALDRKETSGKITYIEEEKNDKNISRYINGEFDSLDPLWVIRLIKNLLIVANCIIVIALYYLLVVIITIMNL